MSPQRFSSGTRFHWQNGGWEVKRLLPDEKINIENILTGATLIVERRTLIKALFDDELWFAIEGKRAAKRELAQYGQMNRPTVPLERVEIDHTRPDVIVVDERDNLPLGQPTLTYCLDIATGHSQG